MTTQPTAALAGHGRTAPSEPSHRHDSACFWDVDACRWECLTNPLRAALECSTPTGRQLAHPATEKPP